MIVDYLTPRGLHICISQGSYALVENMVREGEFGEWNIEDIRKATSNNRDDISRPRYIKPPFKSPSR